MGLSRRLMLHSVLEDILGSENVYFQPPEGRLLAYPAIVYERDKPSVKHADNIPYNIRQAYQVTHIAENPDSAVLDALLELPLCAFNRHFATSGLNHDVFVIYH